LVAYRQVTCTEEADDAYEEMLCILEVYRSNGYGGAYGITSWLAEGVAYDFFDDFHVQALFERWESNIPQLLEEELAWAREVYSQEIDRIQASFQTNVSFDPPDLPFRNALVRHIESRDTDLEQFVPDWKLDLEDPDYLKRFLSY